MHNHPLRNIILIIEDGHPSMVEDSLSYLRVKQILITKRTEQLLLVFIQAGRSEALLALGTLQALLVEWCAV